MLLTRLLTTVAAALRPVPVRAHCDTADGPAVTAGRRALETGDVTPALAWIPAGGEAELRDVFDRALRVRVLGPDAAVVADRLFLETLVRLHRQGEGVGFTGIQPAGAHVDPVVAAADAALESGSDDDLLALLPPERRAPVHALFGAARAARDHDAADVDAGRRAVAAYVAFVQHAEGEDHGHHDDGSAREHAHAHAH
ncbi:DUF6448 family protein [Actinotalea solisilvae]|uniref:DUF6448 family protein n=1 Tax=Actinotalea solisilvae TaxID=2072922 RepID=UPI0018F1A6B4|nr:DUF6448 family protein [Actinotalea solisilvae]